MLLVGKRGYGKSYTMGVIAESLARSPGVAPVLVDPMGAFDTLAESADGEAVPASVVGEPTVTAASLDPRSWCELLGLSPERGAGSLLWRAAQNESTIEDMLAHVASTDASRVAVRAATNHLRLADSWGVFDPDGLDATALGGPEISVVDISGLAAAPMNAVCRGVAGGAVPSAGPRIDRSAPLAVARRGPRVLRRRGRTRPRDDPHAGPCAWRQSGRRDPTTECRPRGRHLTVGHPLCTD